MKTAIETCWQFEYDGAKYRVRHESDHPDVVWVFEDCGDTLILPVDQLRFILAAIEQKGAPNE
jgi:hypothetical protein